MLSVFSNNEIVENFVNQIKTELNKELSNLRDNASPRTVGDTAQDVIEHFFENGLTSDFGQAIQQKFARRAMADVAFTDTNENYIVVDVKTHNESTDFNMPNLISVERLARFYRDDTNFFSLLVAKYDMQDNKPHFNNVLFLPIEHLDWNCLTIGALGWGQIQIANANVINSNPGQTRKEWMLKLCDALDIFYPREIEKINNRISYFNEIRDYWENK